MDPAEQAFNLSSTAAVGTATLVLVEWLKQSPICRYRWLVNIPVFVYTVLIAIALGLIANKVMMNEKGEPLLPGPTLLIVWKCVMAAAGASGAYTWLRNPEKLRDANDLTKSPTKPPAWETGDQYANDMHLDAATRLGGSGLRADAPSGTCSHQGGNGPVDPNNPERAQEVGSADGH